MTVSARTIDDGITHEVTRDWSIGPRVACGIAVTWTGGSYSRCAERYEDREVDCMACVAAGVGDQWSEPARVLNPCGEIALGESGTCVPPTGGGDPGEPGFLPGHATILTG
jgi:hypothetical protein